MTTYQERQLHEADRVSIGELIGDITRDLSTLVRQELELAKAEARQSAKRAGRGAVMIAGCGLAALLALSFLSVSAWWALGGPVGRTWSALIVGGAWILIALILGMTGRSQIRDVPGLPQTVETTRRIPDAIRGREHSIS